VAFSKPPVGKTGYNEGEVDAFLDRVKTELSGNALIASVSIAEVTARPAQHGGSPVLILDGPGLETLAITPHPPPGQWRKWPKSKKPAYLAVEAEWLVLAEKFGLASDLVEEWQPHTFSEHVMRFTQERGSYGPKTWRTPLVFGTLVVVPACIYGTPVLILIGVLLLILAAVAWRFKWEI
jgi:DivIVA domain-containing protein